jgi:N-acetylmuramic acid 6-phosphate etherase
MIAQLRQSIFGFTMMLRLITFVAPMKKKLATTEMSSLHQQLHAKTVSQLLEGINQEDLKVAVAVQKELPAIEQLILAVVQKMKVDGRLFYMGSGTSGRLGIVDASECPPTFGVDHGLVVGLIAGGTPAILKAVEFAEDDPDQGWTDLKEHNISQKDFVIGISASGTAPYVEGALKRCKSEGIATGSIACNTNSVIGNIADHKIEVIVGPEYVTGSTRMKSGTAQKMVLNMITTTAMIQLGHVIGNKMVDMQLSNKKLVDRGTRMIMEECEIAYDLAKSALLEHGSVRAALQIIKGNS